MKYLSTSLNAVMNYRIKLFAGAGGIGAVDSQCVIVDFETKEILYIGSRLRLSWRRALLNDR